LEKDVLIPGLVSAVGRGEAAVFRPRDAERARRVDEFLDEVGRYRVESHGDAAAVREVDAK